MSKATKKTFQINSFGFPIFIVDCPHIEIDGKSEPDVDYNRLEDMIFEALPFKPSKLNGAEIKFIRHHLKMTQARFSAWLSDSKDPSSIAVWEKSDLNSTSMDNAMERSLRLQLIAFINKKKRRKSINLDETLERLTLSMSRKSAKRIELDSDYLPIPGTGLAPELQSIGRY